ncbi:MAG: hypothetical protein MR384_02075 [Lachnospiraceae bacterium]|nr:hypothetical protein [Lachnospiraceae bacterium]MCI5586658.1 hypothetical protein [Lachnospiraceae bacterium]
MSLSIDYFTMPPKSQEVSQIQSAEQTKLHQENQEFAAQFQHQVEQNSQTTIRRREVENDELKNDEKKQKNQSKGKKNSKKNNKKEDKESVNLEGNSFDIKI